MVKYELYFHHSLILYKGENKMSDIVWLKLYTGLFDGEKLKFVEAMENRDIIVCILIKLFIQAAKTNDKGSIYFNKKTPYTNQMFSIIFNRSLSAIECAFKVLSDFQMIEIDENNFISICNWEKYQNVESMERSRALNRNRVRDHRARKKANEL
jgi:predicted phage replisome organizer